jgi:hypothetical protein
MPAHPGRRFSALSLALLAGSTLGQAEPLPVSAVTLYRSGVGSFERTGTVTGDATVQLAATADQIDDLLKSLVVLDLDGGRVGAVTYTADEPVARLLEALGISSPEQVTLGRIIAGFRGAEVTLEVTGQGELPGRVLGSDVITESTGESGTISRQRVSLLTPMGVRTVMEQDIRSLRFTDAKTQADLDALMAALAQLRGDQKRSLGIELAGQGDRRIRAVYTQETPIWKTSYRVILPDNDADPLRLQGWAIVENTTDSDWNGIALSLAAGRPVGFEMNLSQPLYLDRPTVPVPVEHAAAPKTFAAGRELEPAEPARDVFARRRDLAARAPAGEMLGIVAGRAAEWDAAVGDSFSPAASAQESGEVFFFTLDQPVTVERRQSAMLPILTEQITGRRVSIASLGDGIAHPMRGLEMTNSTDLKLMPGPVSVFDGSVFAGDAQIGYVGVGDDRLLAYAVDLDVALERRTTQDNAVRKLRIVDGVFMQTTAMITRETVTLNNRDARRGRTVIAEAHRYDGWSQTASHPVHETAPGLSRFELTLDPGADETLEVTQELITESTIALADVSIDQLVVYQRQGAASDAVVEAFRVYAQKRAAVAEAQERLAADDEEAARIDDDQGRIRQLIAAVSRQDELHARYLRQLGSHEDRLDQLRAARPGLLRALDDARRELDQYVRTMKAE